MLVFVVLNIKHRLSEHTTGGAFLLLVGKKTRVRPLTKTSAPEGDPLMC